MKRSLKRLALLSALALIAALGGCEGEKEVRCFCGRNECTVSPPDEYLFAFSYYGLREIAVGEKEEAVYLSHLGEDCLTKGRDILNGFMPKDPHGEAVQEDGAPEGGVKVRVMYYDMAREFYLEGDSIIINNKRYAGEEGCLDWFYELQAGKVK